MDEQRLIVRYKARLVAKGYVQKDGADPDETFAKVISFDVILLIVRKSTLVPGMFTILAFPLLS